MTSLTFFLCLVNFVKYINYLSQFRPIHHPTVTYHVAFIRVEPLISPSSCFCLVLIGLLFLFTISFIQFIIFIMTKSDAMRDWAAAAQRPPCLVRSPSRVLSQFVPREAMVERTDNIGTLKMNI